MLSVAVYDCGMDTHPDPLHSSAGRRGHFRARDNDDVDKYWGKESLLVSRICNSWMARHTNGRSE